mmetsp:Transcript_5528/g.11369  ORF Transcript_5528/g.11369 Transcript_5528/m.11369 type:complete len:247 (+) Transcript_5528:167-907(+)|eukprot:CAMPEP_0171497736 /NCGR_PEP_ID=MMETSP0958-20121227/7443_1 /TAXON_ID=87120 /ORGANISM="Aurantiochytrium limacinum, Strain ATCCMYA-1381" /LENGTH=246 /DNA_ID=CAMNT_0012032023 /DNA_START=174 /DNA_END=914 /DNA_ORIENTATION=+
MADQELKKAKTEETEESEEMFKKKNSKKAAAAAAAAASDEETWLEKSVARKMSMENLTHGKRLTPFDPYTFDLGTKWPEELPVFIEVAMGSRNKFEWDQDAGVLMLDRVIHSSMHYPNDYGFIPSTLCDDGDPLDILVMGTQPLVPGCICKARPIAYMVMEDEKGMDEKVLAVLANDAMFSDVHTLEDLPSHKLREISHFFETYKALERNKWAKVGEWHGTEETYELIKRSHNAFLEKSQAIEESL